MVPTTVNGLPAFKVPVLKVKLLTVVGTVTATVTPELKVALSAAPGT
jgi:hypothetical protein